MFKTKRSKNYYSIKQKYIEKQPHRPPLWGPAPAPPEAQRGKQEVTAMWRWPQQAFQAFLHQDAHAPPEASKVSLFSSGSHSVDSKRVPKSSESTQNPTEKHRDLLQSFLHIRSCKAGTYCTCTAQSSTTGQTSSAQQPQEAGDSTALERTGERMQEYCTQSQ